VVLREKPTPSGGTQEQAQIPLARRAMRKVVSMRVLLVDDQDDFRMGLRSILESEGFEVADAANAEDALERVIRCAPDVVLMDLHIPGISGIEATQRLLRQAPQIAVVVLSMYEGEELISLALDAGASSYVVKDASLEEMLSAIKAAALDDSAALRG
jgi:DNA-binding NarL/FixJ family response regulator